MGKRTARKLSVKRETMRRLGALTEDQLRVAAGGTKLVMAYDYNKLVIQEPLLMDTLICAGIQTTGGGGVRTLRSCDTKCDSLDCY